MARRPRVETMNDLTRIDEILREHGDLIYVVFLYLSLLLFGFILARQKPTRRRSVVLILPVILPPPRADEEPPVLPPADQAP